MSNVVETLQNFLAQACKEPVSVSSEIIDEFGELCKEAFKKQFTQERERKNLELECLTLVGPYANCKWKKKIRVLILKSNLIILN